MDGDPVIHGRVTRPREPTGRKSERRTWRFGELTERWRRSSTATTGATRVRANWPVFRRFLRTQPLMVAGSARRLKMSVDAETTLRILIVCGEVAERLKAAVC
jgi:hypothetical protein